MAKIYFKRIQNGDMLLSEVPSRWYSQVETLIQGEKGSNVG